MFYFQIMHKDGFEDGYKAYLEYLRNDDRFYLGSKVKLLIFCVSWVETEGGGAL